MFANEVYLVGKIDREIYKCITEEILTDEVVLTEERIGHIKKRHPQDYERYQRYIAEILGEPDYIIQANKPNTGIVLKEIAENGEKFQLVIKLKMQGDKPEFKNSVITFLKINERTWYKYLRNKKVLYKRD